MKLEQNVMRFGAAGAKDGYIDLARALSAVNGKSIAQTKRSDGKYKPIGFLIRIRTLSGNVTVNSLNCGYPTRNSVVLAGHARDEMLKSAGISRSNLESYQKELRILMDSDHATDGSTDFFPGGTNRGTTSIGDNAYGAGLTYDYTKLVFSDPDTAGTEISTVLRMLGTQSEDSDNWDTDGGVFVVDNWYQWRHSFTPAADTDDIANNVFSWAIQQSDTAEKVIDMIDTSQDEKPYDLTEFRTKPMSTVVGTDVGNPTSAVFCAPLGLLNIVTTDSAIWEVEVVGVVEL